MADQISITFNFSPERWQHVQDLGRMLGRWATLGGVPPEDWPYRDMLKGIQAVDPVVYEMVLLLIQGGAKNVGVDWLAAAQQHGIQTG